MRPKKLKVIVQGEVIIRELAEDRRPEASANLTGIVATGETGNPHTIMGGKFELFGNALAAGNLLRVTETTQLVHGTEAHSGHEVAIIPPGVYEINPQRERDLLTRRSRTVLD